MCNVKIETRDSQNFVFDFEKLHVYKEGMKFLKKIFNITNNLPRQYQFSVGDQIRRSALSIVNNIAEGSGKISKKEKKQFYCTSLNSGRECIPMLTLLEEEKIIDKDLYYDLRGSCIYICNMLGKLIYSLQ